MSKDGNKPSGIDTEQRPAQGGGKTAAPPDKSRRPPISSVGNEKN